jgi:hypothetical protein
VVALEVAAAGAIAGVLTNFTGYAITGRIFHRFQALTPHTWRKPESWMHYLTSAGVRILACIGIALLYDAVGFAARDLFAGEIANGAAFGFLIWACGAAPVILETALFVNWHRGFVVGLLLDWLVLSVVAGVVASLARRFLMVSGVFVLGATLLGGCGSSANNPASTSGSGAAGADVIVTFDAAHRTCVVAIRNEAQGSTIPCSEVVPFLRDEMRVASGSTYDLRAAGVDEAEKARVAGELKAAGYRFVGGGP